MLRRTHRVVLLLHSSILCGERVSRGSSSRIAILRPLSVENLDSGAARAYGEIRATLEEKGRLIGNNDLWIGAHAMALDVTLATNNEREFKRIAGLSVENWTK